MSIPVGCCFFHSFTNIFTGLEPSPFQCQGAQNLPPWLNKVKIRRVFGLEHKLPARIYQREQEYIIRPVSSKVVNYRNNSLYFRWQPLVNLLQKVYVVDGRPSAISFRNYIAISRLERPENVTLATPTIVNLLLGSLNWLPSFNLSDQFSARMTLRRLWPNFVQTNDYASLRSFRIHLGDDPFFRRNQGLPAR